MNYIITAKCVNGHSQDIVVDGWLGLDWVQEHANLLDGTSPLYINPKPAEDKNSIIGKCGVCKAKIFCRVSAQIPTDEDVKLPKTD